MTLDFRAQAAKRAANPSTPQQRLLRYADKVTGKKLAKEAIHDLITAELGLAPVSTTSTDTPEAPASSELQLEALMRRPRAPLAELYGYTPLNIDEDAVLEEASDGMVDPDGTRDVAPARPEYQHILPILMKHLRKEAIKLGYPAVMVTHYT